MKQKMVQVLTIENGEIVTKMVPDEIVTLDPEGTGAPVFKNGIALGGYDNLDQDQIDAIEAEEAKARGGKRGAK